MCIKYTETQDWWVFKSAKQHFRSWQCCMTGYVTLDMSILCIKGKKNKYRLMLFSSTLEEPICIQFTCYIWGKAQSAHIITADFYFHQEHSKAHLHSRHIHTRVLFHLLFFISVYSSFSFALTSSFVFLLSLLPSVFSLSCHYISGGCTSRTVGFSFRRPCCGLAAAGGLW